MKGYGQALIGENTGDGITGSEGLGAEHIEKLISSNVKLRLHNLRNRT